MAAATTESVHPTIVQFLLLTVTCGGVMMGRAAMSMMEA